MGRRVNYELCGDGTVAAILFSNSHHDSESPEAVFEDGVARFGCGITALVEHLLKARYTVESGQHRVGDRMFWVDLAPGDREEIVKVNFSVDPPVITRQPVKNDERGEA